MCKGKCIICRQDNVELSDEHVIPDALGGHYHIYKVCKVCNSNLGEAVDTHLTNHLFIQFARNKHRLEGKKHHIPNPLVGPGILNDGTKVRVEEDENGVLYPYVIPKSPQIDENGVLNISVDAKDEALVGKMISKFLKRNGYDDCQSLSKNVQKIDHPWVKMQFNVDLKYYNIGLLKIAYEFTVDKIPNYYNDPKALKYSQIIYDVAYNKNFNQLGDVEFLGNGIQNASMTLLEDFIDASKTDRHILMLMNVDGKLHCLIKLFESTFCQMICMSDQEYQEISPLFLAINDFKECKCNFYDTTELIESCIKEEKIYVEFSDEEKKKLEDIIQTMNSASPIGFVANFEGDNIIYDKNKNAVTTQNRLVLQLKHLSNESVSENQQSISYPIPPDLEVYLLLDPFSTLVRPKRFVYERILQKV